MVRLPSGQKRISTGFLLMTVILSPPEYQPSKPVKYLCIRIYYRLRREKRPLFLLQNRFTSAKTVVPEAFPPGSKAVPEGIGFAPIA